MLYGLVIVVHVIVCLVLILVILLQAGRGGGLSEAFGGNLGQSIFGTKANVFLTRATSVCAIVFLCTCILLGVMTSRKGKSLIDIQKLLESKELAAAASGDQEGSNLEENDLGEAVEETKDQAPGEVKDIIPKE